MRARFDHPFKYKACVTFPDNIAHQAKEAPAEPTLSSLLSEIIHDTGLEVLGKTLLSGGAGVIEDLGKSAAAVISTAAQLSADQLAKEQVRKYRRLSQ